MRIHVYTHTSRALILPYHGYICLRTAFLRGIFVNSLSPACRGEENAGLEEIGQHELDIIRTVLRLRV